MTIDSWDPDAGQKAAPFSLNEEQLALLLSISRNGQSDNLANALNADQQNTLRPAMKQERQFWLDVAEQLSSNDIVDLIRFFTLAEMQLTGWQAGERSPVIGLVKALRKRGDAPEKTLLQWIKDNSDNRYLPNGPLL